MTLRLNPIFDEVAWIHGFAPADRPLGGVATSELVRVAPPLTDLVVNLRGHDKPDVPLPLGYDPRSPR
jgi:hypothetical protein